MEEGEKAFEDLKRSNAYSYDIATTEDLKRRIFLSFWNNHAERLAKQFYPAGKRGGEKNEEQFGFGFIVEEFAKLSEKTPKNSESCAGVESIILSALHTGNDHLTGTHERRRNPDMVWLKRRGCSIEIVGMGEVKSSLSAYLSKGEQILLQEESLRDLVGTVREQKVAGRAHAFFKNKSLKISDQLQKIMIVPAGIKESIAKYLPESWECTELEFSYDEFMFIAQKLWPEFREEKIFGKNIVAGLEGSFFPFLFEIKEPQILWKYEKIDDQKFPAREIVIFAYATKRFPKNADDTAVVENLTKNWQSHFLSYPLFGILREGQLEAEEKKMYNSLIIIRPDLKKEILFFLTNLRSFSEKLKENKKDSKLLEFMEPVKDFF